VVAVGGQGSRDAEKLIVMGKTNQGLGFSFLPAPLTRGSRNPIPGDIHISKAGSKGRLCEHSQYSKHHNLGSTP